MSKMIDKRVAEEARRVADILTQELHNLALLKGYAKGTGISKGRIRFCD